MAELMLTNVMMLSILIAIFTLVSLFKKVKEWAQLFMETHLRATERHQPYEITRLGYVFEPQLSIPVLDLFILEG